MAATPCSRRTCTARAAVSSLSSSLTSIRDRGPNLNRLCPNFFTPKICPNPTLNLLRLEVYRRKSKASAFSFRDSIVYCLAGDNFEECPESGNLNASNESTTGESIDIKLPRRSLSVHFTCNACGVRSQKLINRLAYERGTVFVQCSGCLQHHMLKDNLGLVVEYDFREETIADPGANEI